MIRELGQPLTAYVTFMDHKNGETGRSPKVDVYRNATQIVSNDDAIELDDGRYYYTLPAIQVNAPGDYQFLFNVPSGVNQEDLWVGHYIVDAQAALDSIIGGVIGSIPAPPSIQAQNFIFFGATVINDGTQSAGTNANINAKDGVTWDIASAGAQLDVEINFDLTNFFLNELHLTVGLVSHANDFANILAWNGTTWDTVSTESTRVNPNLGLLNIVIGVDDAYVDANLFRMRISGGMRVASTLSIDFAAALASTTGDYVLTASEVAEATASKMVDTVYRNTIYLDTVNGTDPAVVTLGDTGSARFPVATLPFALASLANPLGNAGIRVSRGSEITLAAGIATEILFNEQATAGNRWALHLGGQDISETNISGADVDGVFTAPTGKPAFTGCGIGNITGPSVVANGSVIKGLIVITSSGGIVLSECVGSVDVNSQIELQDAAAPAKLYNYQGAVEFIGLQAGNDVEITGSGSLIIDATSTGGTVIVEGNWTVVDNSAGAVTIVDDNNFSMEVLIPDTADAVWDELKADHQLPGSFGEHVQTNTGASGAAVNTTASGYVLTLGIESGGTIANTKQVNTVYHEHTDAAGALDLYYEFNVGGDGIPTGATIVGRINGANDNLDGVYVYDWTTSQWEQIGVYAGTNSTADHEDTFSLLTDHVGTGADVGKVRIRFYAAAGLSNATLYIDRIFVSYAIVSRSVGYVDGSVWIDTNASNTNTEPYIDGTADNPVSTLAAATTLANSLGLKIFSLLADSSIVLQQAYFSFTFRGYFAEIDLNGQNVSGCIFQAMRILGNDGGVNDPPAAFINCRVQLSTLGISLFDRCRIAGTLVVAEAGDYFFNDCYSAVAGTGAPVFDFGSSIGNTNVSFRHYSGGIEIRNMGVTGVDAMSLEGEGQLKINANCTGGEIALRGHFFVTDNAAGAVTLADKANFDKSVLIPEQTADIGALTAIDVENTVWNADKDDHMISNSYGEFLDIPVSTRAFQGDVDDILTILTSTGVTLTVAQVNELIKGLLTTGTGTNTIEDDAETLSIAQFIHSLLRATINGQTNELVIFKGDGSTEWARIPVVSYIDADPLISVGAA